VTAELILDKRQNPPDSPEERDAYNNTLSDAELRAAMEKEDASKNSIRGQFNARVSELQQGGVVPPKATLDDVFKCVYAALNPVLYEGRPKVSILLQYFRRPWMIEEYVRRTAACSSAVPLELLVNVDSPGDAAAWAAVAANSSGLTVLPLISNNVHEVRAYNRLAHLARGDLLVLAADDDYFPAGGNCSWLLDIVRVFERWPQAGVLGLRRATVCMKSDGKEEVHRDPVLGLQLQFAQVVDMAPMAVRRSAYLHVGGLDETASEPGECGVMSDWDLCVRMWKAGWQVMTTRPVPMENDGQAGGTHRPGKEKCCFQRQLNIAVRMLNMHVDMIFGEELCVVVKNLTRTHMEVVAQPPVHTHQL